MSRHFIFDKLSVPGGKFEINLITQNDEQLVLNGIDRDFYPYDGETLGWEAWATGSSVYHNTGTYELEVVGGCRLNGAAEISPFVNGAWYKITFDVYFTVGVNHRIRVLNADGLQLFETALSQSNQSFYFKAGSYPLGIIFMHSDTGGTRAFRLDNVSIEPVVKCHLVELSNIAYGNDSDDDLIMYPGNCTFALKLKEKLSNTLTFKDSEIYLKNIFIDGNTILNIIKDNGGPSYLDEIYFTGKLDTNDMGFSQEKGTYNFRFLDDLSNLKDERSINHSGTFNKEKLSDFIESRVASTEISIGRTVEFKVRWQAYDYESAVWRDIEDFYVDTVGLENFYYNPFMYNGDVLKAILSNLGAYGIAAPNYKYYILPKFDNGEMEIETLYNDEMPELKLFSYDKEEGINFYEHDGTGNYIEPTTIIENYKDIYLPIPNSNTDRNETSQSKTLYVTSDLHHVLSNAIRYKINSTTWSASSTFDAHDFKYWLDQIYLQTKEHLNKGIIVKPTGINYPYDKFYEILKSRSNPVRLIDTVFRAVDFKVDIQNNQTEITLIPAPPLVF